MEKNRFVYDDDMTGWGPSTGKFCFGMVIHEFAQDSVVSVFVLDSKSGRTGWVPGFNVTKCE